MQKKQKLIQRIARYEELGRFDWAQDVRKILEKLEKEEKQLDSVKSNKKK